VAAPSLRGQHRAGRTAGVSLGVSERVLQGDAETRLAQLTGGPGAAASNSRAGPSKPERR